MTGTLKTVTQYLKKQVPEDYYAWMDTVTKFLALRPPKGGRKKIPYILMSILHHLVTLVTPVCLEFTELFLGSEKGFEYSVMTMLLCLLHSIALMRAVFWFLTLEKMDKVRAAVQRRSFEFSCFGIYRIKYGHLFRGIRQSDAIFGYEDLKKIWRGAETTVNQDNNKIESYRMQKMAYIRMICCSFFISVNVLGLITIAAPYIDVLYTETYEAYNAKLNVTSTYRIYPFHMYLPFDTSLSHGHYWVGYFYQWYAHCFVLLTFLPIDTMIVNSIIHLTGQSMVVSEAFGQIAENIDHTQKPEAILLIQEIRMVKCMTELQEIFRALYIIENFVNVLILVQYGVFIFVLCTSLYLMALADGTGEFMCSFLILLSVLGQIFILTYCSHMLTLELQKVVQSVYNLNWTSYPPRLRRNLTLLISRLQKPCVLRAGKLFNMDLLFFIEVIQKGYSFYTFITNTK